MVVKGGRIEGIPVRKGWRRVGEERHPRHGFHSGPFGATTSVEKFFLAAVAGHQISRNMPTIMGFRIINLLYRVYYSNTVSLPSSCSSCPQIPRRCVELVIFFFFTKRLPSVAATTVVIREFVLPLEKNWLSDGSIARRRRRTFRGFSSSIQRGVYISI